MTKSPALGSVGRQAPGGDPRHDLTNPYCFDVGGQALQVFPRDPGRGLFLRRHFLLPAAGLFVVFAASQAIAGAGPSSERGSLNLLSALIWPSQSVGCPSGCCTELMITRRFSADFSPLMVLCFILFGMVFLFSQPGNRSRATA